MGLHHAGFWPVGVVERDLDCCNTIRENTTRGARAMRGWHLVPDDVREVNFSAFCDALDLVSGGPPCQPFSLEGVMKLQS